MYLRVLAAAAAALSLSAGAASAAVIIQAPSDLLCQRDSCVGVERGVGAKVPFVIDSLSLDRNLLGDLGGALVRISFWSSDGTKLVGEFGDFMLSVLGGDQLTLKGRGVTVGGGVGDLIFRIERLDFSGGGAGGGGGFGFGDAGFGGAPIHGPGPDSRPPPASGPLFESDGALDNLISPSAAIVVPEPSLWALLMLGFGLVGALARARTRPQPA